MRSEIERRGWIAIANEDSFPPALGCSHLGIAGDSIALLHHDLVVAGGTYVYGKRMCHSLAIAQARTHWLGRAGQFQSSVAGSSKTPARASRGI